MTKKGIKAKLLRLLLVCMMLLVLPLTSLSAEEVKEDVLYRIESYHEQIDGYVDLYNENLDVIPGVLKTFFSNERINFYIEFPGDETEVIGVVTTKDAAISKFASGGIVDPTLMFYIESETIDSLIADPSTDAFFDALEGIEKEGVGFGKMVKVIFIDIAIKAARMFL